MGTGLCLSLPLLCPGGWVPPPQWVSCERPGQSLMWLWEAFSDRGVCQLWEESPRGRLP